MRNIPLNQKNRRHSGRRYTKIYHPEETPLEEEKWDDWVDYRDGQRDVGNDKSKICKKDCKHNKKLKKKEKVRKVKQAKHKLKENGESK